MGRRTSETISRLLIKALLLGMAVVVVSWVVGCAPADVAPEVPAEETPGEEPSMAVEVGMGLSSFQPAEITVGAGTTVTWRNDSGVEHTVTSGARNDPTGLFDERVPAGGSFSFEFDEPGTYEYFCRIHPGMDAVVIVE